MLVTIIYNLSLLRTVHMNIIFNTLKSFYKKPVINSLSNCIIKHFITPPYLTDTMEIEYGLWEGISSIHCNDGRQLGENNVKPLYLQDHSIKTNLHVSKHEGSRSGLIVNMTALQILMREWDESLKIIGAVKNIYLTNYKNESSPFNLYDLFIIAKICVSLPIFSVRKSNPIYKDNQLPSRVSAQFQLISGVFMIVRRMIEKGDSYIFNDIMPPAEKLFDYAENNSVFISEKNGQVCGGSKKKIIELLDFILKDNTSNENDSIECIKSIVGEVDRFFKYSLAAVELEILMAETRVVSHKILFMSNDINNLCGKDNSSSDVISKYSRTLMLYSSLLSYMDLSDKNLDSGILEINQNILTNNIKLLSLYNNLINSSYEVVIKQQAVVNELLGRRTNIKLDIKKFLFLISGSKSKCLSNT